MIWERFLIIALYSNHSKFQQQSHQSGSKSHHKTQAAHLLQKRQLQGKRWIQQQIRQRSSCTHSVVCVHNLSCNKPANKDLRRARHNRNQFYCWSFNKRKSTSRTIWWKKKTWKITSSWCCSQEQPIVIPSHKLHWDDLYATRYIDNVLIFSHHILWKISLSMI